MRYLCGEVVFVLIYLGSDVAVVLARLVYKIGLYVITAYLILYLPMVSL